MASHREIYRDARFYCAHPHVVRAADGSLLVVATRAPRRAVVLHPPHDPAFHNVALRSTDDGVTWSAPLVVPDPSWSGMECAGLTRLRDGRIMLNQWRFNWRAPGDAGDAVLDPAGLIAERRRSAELDFSPANALASADVSPLVREGGESWVHFSSDNGRSFGASVRLDVAPFRGGYGMRGGLELADGRIFLPLCDVPDYRQVFAVWSEDGGAHWSAPRLIASHPEREYEEPAPLLTRNGRLLLALRENVGGVLHVTWSDDGGHHWSAARPTGIEEYPAHLLQWPSGQIACNAGRRKPPYGIRVIVSRDNGETWDTAAPIIIRDDLPNKNLGYPTGLVDPGGSLTTIYYGEDERGITGLDLSTLPPETNEEHSP